jgi:hydrogenase 3 maturation protease
MRSDDYVGLKIVEDLKGKVSDKVCLIEAETVPESYITEIEEYRPSHILLIDAATYGGEAGETRLLDAVDIGLAPSISSHVLPLRIFCEYLKKTTGAKIGLLLVQPKTLEFGEGLSGEVADAAKRITDSLLGLLG